MGVKRVGIVVSGRVQGVGYRMFARDLANQYAVAGWVKNLPDGSVEAAIEGESKAVDEMVQGLYARDSYVIQVDQIIITEQAPAGTQGFEIRR